MTSYLSGLRSINKKVKSDVDSLVKQRPRFIQDELDNMTNIKEDQGSQDLIFQDSMAETRKSATRELTIDELAQQMLEYDLRSSDEFQFDKLLE